MILVVDDHADSCRTAALHLAMAGYRAVCVHTADEALAAIVGEYPALIILDDYLKSSMDGIDLIPFLRCDPGLDRVPIIIYTAGTDSSRKDRGMQRGATAWLEKGQVGWPDLIDRCRALTLPEA